MGIKRIGDNVWRLEWYPEGRKKDSKTGKPNSKRETTVFAGSEAEARMELAALNRSSRKPSLISPNFRQVLGDFLIWYSNKNASGSVDVFMSAWKNHLDPFFGGERPNRLTPNLIEQYKSARLKAVKPRTVERELHNLSVFIKWMVRNNYADPLRFKIETFPKSKTRSPAVMVPTEQQLDAIFNEIIMPQQDIYRIIYLCGLRKSEALLLTVKRINLDGGFMIVLGKGNKERYVPINDQAKQILTRTIKDKKPDALVWESYRKPGKPYRNIEASLKRAARRAGIDLRMYPHLMRHSAYTHLAQHGANAFQIQTMAGHEDMETSQKYIHMALATLTDLVKKIDRSQ